MRLNISEMQDYRIEFKTFAVFPSFNFAEMNSRFDSEQPKNLNPPGANDTYNYKATTYRCDPVFQGKCSFIESTEDTDFWGRAMRCTMKAFFAKPFNLLQHVLRHFMDQEF